MLRHNVIHLIHQIQSLECDVSTAFLKVANSEQLIFENLLMRIIAHKIHKPDGDIMAVIGFAPIFPDTCYHLTHYWPAAADIPVASDNPVHYADAIRYNARTPLQGSLLPLTRLV